MSAEQSNLSPSERELERALCRLAPAPAVIDTTALAFAAGRRSTRLKLVGWRAAAAVLAVALIAATFMQPGPRVVERIVTLEIPQPPSAALALDNPPPQMFAPAPAPAYLVLRNAVLEHGIDAISAPVEAPARLVPPRILRAGDIYRIGEQL